MGRGTRDSRERERVREKGRYRGGEGQGEGEGHDIVSYTAIHKRYRLFPQVFSGDVTHHNTDD